MVRPIRIATVLLVRWAAALPPTRVAGATVRPCAGISKGCRSVSRSRKVQTARTVRGLYIRLGGLGGARAALTHCNGETHGETTFVRRRARRPGRGGPGCGAEGRDGGARGLRSVHSRG